MVHEYVDKNVRLQVYKKDHLFYEQILKTIVKQNKHYLN